MGNCSSKKEPKNKPDPSPKQSGFNFFNRGSINARNQPLPSLGGPGGLNDIGDLSVRECRLIPPAIPFPPPKRLYVDSNPGKIGSPTVGLGVGTIGSSASSELARKSGPSVNDAPKFTHSSTVRSNNELGANDPTRAPSSHLSNVSTANTSSPSKEVDLLDLKNSLSGGKMGENKQIGSSVKPTNRYDNFSPSAYSPMISLDWSSASTSLSTSPDLSTDSSVEEIVHPASSRLSNSTEALDLISRSATPRDAYTPSSVLSSSSHKPAQVADSTFNLRNFRSRKTDIRPQAPVLSFYIPRRLPPSTADGKKLTGNKARDRLSKLGKSKLSYQRGKNDSLNQLRQKWSAIKSLITPHDWFELLQLNNAVLVNLKIIQYHDNYVRLVEEMDDFAFCCNLFKVLAVVASSKFEYLKLNVMREIALPNFVSDVHSLIDRLFIERPPPRKLDNFVESLVAVYANIFLQLDSLIEDNFTSELEQMVVKCLALFDSVPDSVNVADLEQLLTIIRAKDFLVRSDSCYPFNILDEESIESNIIQGPFENFDRYLSIQYRLLKEDFQNTLRVGIFDYLEHLHGKRKRSQYDYLKVYNDVRLDANVTDIRVKYRITLTRPSEIEKATDRGTGSNFFNGSLLLLTDPSEPFAEYFLVKVEDSYPLDAKKPFFFVSIVLGPEELMYREYKGLLMVEPAHFFEPYYRVLNVIRSIDGNNFPFLRYIVDVSTDVSPPSFFDDATQLQIDGFTVPLWDDECWPLPEQIGLNRLQLEGLKLAMRSELAIIQGPPGTGKTYLSRKIIDVMLQNKNLWHNKSCDGAGMILVVCYKNQSLDQLLGSLVKTNRKVVRVGLQSRDESLDGYNLRTLSVPKGKPYYPQVKKKIKEEQQAFAGQLKEAIKIVNCVNKYDGLIKYDELMKNISLPEVSEGFIGNDMDSWLFGSNSDFKCIYDVKSLLDEKISSWAEAVEEELVTASIMSVTIQDLNTMCSKLNDKIKESKSDSEDYVRKLFSAVDYVKSVFDQLEGLMRFVSKPMTNIELDRIAQIKSIASSGELSDTLVKKDRRLLYKHWLAEYRKTFMDRVAWLENRLNEYTQMNVEFQELYDLEKLLQCDAEVIGMTTTAAAKYHKTLHYLKPRIVLVEEAAEVMEVHTIAALSEHCNHLILVGDHKQLRPLTSSHLIGKDAHLDISMYERLVNNKYPHCTLNTQFRMRPEIAALISPSVYTNLINHPSVQQLPPVLGVRKNLYFVDHSAKETKAEGMPSIYNKHEAEFHMALCRYLIKQGYQPSQITVLATYSVQEKYFIQEKDNFPELAEVEFVTVDSFQGKENDIILLSLVRSNMEGNIGFLGLQNRINVALSRAKIGLFITGNSSILTKKNSLWPEVLETLKRTRSIGRAIPLQCQIHKEITEVAKPQDFAKVANGGCSRVCGQQLDCTHKCTLPCHPMDREHMGMFGCRATCNRMMPCKHRCTRECHFRNTSRQCFCKRCSAQLQCGEILACGHLCKKTAHLEDPDHLDTYMCSETCETVLDCGHTCKSLCHLVDRDHKKDYKCPIQCKGTLHCGHLCRLVGRPKHDCSDHKNICCQLCKAVLSCGHKCLRFAHVEDLKHENALSRCPKCVAAEPIRPETTSDPIGQTDTVAKTANETCPSNASVKNRPRLCGAELPCGNHKCEKISHNCDNSSHAEVCRRQMTATFECGHSQSFSCYLKNRPKNKICAICSQQNSLESNEPPKAKKSRCGVRLPCGIHQCGKMSHNCNNSSHAEVCRRQMTATFECGHSQSFSCYLKNRPKNKICAICSQQNSLQSNEPPKAMKSRCGVRLPCGIHQCGKMSHNCNNSSHAEVCRRQMTVTFECGHSQSLMCYLKNQTETIMCAICSRQNSLLSNEPPKAEKILCGVRLPCGIHQCEKMSHNCNNSSHAEVCRRQMTVAFECGHSKSFPCNLKSQPENKICAFCSRLNSLSSNDQPMATIGLCGIELPCGIHKCELLTGHSANSLHMSVCQRVTIAVLKCGHTASFTCNLRAQFKNSLCSVCIWFKSCFRIHETSLEQGGCGFVRKCGHVCRKHHKQGSIHEKECKESRSLLPCGHTVNVKCKILEKPMCPTCARVPPDPCGFEFNCGHVCKELSGHLSRSEHRKCALRSIVTFLCGHFEIHPCPDVEKINSNSCFSCSKGKPTHQKGASFKTEAPSPLATIANANESSFLNTLPPRRFTVKIVDTQGANICRHGSSPQTCHLSCLENFECGHSCKKLCSHPDNPEHFGFCPRCMCTVPLPDLCGFAYECGHNCEMELAHSQIHIKCPKPCIITYDCGHTEVLQCGNVKNTKMNACFYCSEGDASSESSSSNSGAQIDNPIGNSKGNATEAGETCPHGVPLNDTCNSPCRKTYICRHACTLVCGHTDSAQHENNCLLCVAVEKLTLNVDRLSLKPQIGVYCFHGLEMASCDSPCPVFLRCGRLCELSKQHHKCSDHAPNGNPCSHACSKPLPCGHLCKKLCHKRWFRASLDDFFHSCGFDCASCEEIDNNTVTDCNLDALPCGGSHPVALHCEKPCKVAYPCGHEKTLSCSCLIILKLSSRSVETAILCKQRCTEKHWRCNHACTNICHLGSPELTCPSCAKLASNSEPKICPHVYPCLHNCNRLEGHNGSHKGCTSRCEKLVSCGHRCARKCHSLKDAHVCLKSCGPLEISVFEASSS